MEKETAMPMPRASYDVGDKFSVTEILTVGTDTYGKTPSGYVHLAAKNGKNCRPLEKS